MTAHIVNISGGKDSAACAILARERGIDFRLVMADTGNESPITTDYANRLADWLDKPLEVVRRDLTAEIARKREYVARVWPTQGVPADTIERALAALVPTGNPFVDLCVWKGRFPSRKAQFCTEFLKQGAVYREVLRPALAAGPVVQWIGVRRDESLNRRAAAMFQRSTMDGKPMLLFRPIIHWTAENVFGFLKAHGAPINPLYLQGMGRVGCFPCINANKGELREIGVRFPEAVEKLMEWEAIVTAASKQQKATFFAPDATPESAAFGRRVKGMPAEEKASTLRSYVWPNAKEVFDWAKTSRGGRQYDMLFDGDGLSCSSQYGLCE